MEAGQVGMAKLDGHNEEKIQRKIPMNTEYFFENDMPTLDEFVSKMVVDTSNYQEYRLAEKIWERVIPNGEWPDQSKEYYKGLGPCWTWQGSKGKGYAKILHGGKLRLAHRETYRMFNGPLQDGMVVMHKCDNPSCVNPLHLKLGTSEENVREAHQRMLSKRVTAQSDKHILMAAHIMNRLAVLWYLYGETVTSNDTTKLKSVAKNMHFYAKSIFVDLAAVYMPDILSSSAREFHLDTDVFRDIKKLVSDHGFRFDDHICQAWRNNEDPDFIKKLDEQLRQP